MSSASLIDNQLSCLLHFQSRLSCLAMAAEADRCGVQEGLGLPSMAHRRQLSDLSAWRRDPHSPTHLSPLPRRRSTTLEGLSLLSALGRRKPIEMSSELKADKLQV